MKIVVCFWIDPELQLGRTEWMHLVKWRYGQTCGRCGTNNVKMHAHHINRNTNDNRLANGESLCKSCHDAEHRAVRSERMRYVRPRISRRGFAMSDEAKAKMRVKALARPPEFYERCIEAKRRNGTDLTVVAQKGWETRRKRGDSNS